MLPEMTQVFNLEAHWFLIYLGSHVVDHNIKYQGLNTDSKTNTKVGFDGNIWNPESTKAVKKRLVPVSQLGLQICLLKLGLKVV